MKATGVGIATNIFRRGRWRTETRLQFAESAQQLLKLLRDLGEIDRCSEAKERCIDEGINAMNGREE